MLCHRTRQTRRYHPCLHLPWRPTNSPLQTTRPRLEHRLPGRPGSGPLKPTFVRASGVCIIESATCPRAPPLLPPSPTQVPNAAAGPTTPRWCPFLMSLASQRAPLARICASTAARLVRRCPSCVHACVFFHVPPPTASCRRSQSVRQVVCAGPRHKNRQRVRRLGRRHHPSALSVPKPRHPRRRKR